MLTAFIHNIQTADNLLRSASALARDLKKELGVLCYADNEDRAKEEQKNIDHYFAENGLEKARLSVKTHPEKMLADDCDSMDASFLIIQMPDTRRRTIQKYLNVCRDLRIPYLFFRDEFPVFDFSKVMLPVGFLVEELEKAQFASAFGRFWRSEILLLLANDYGSKAATNAGKMKELFDKFDFRYMQEKASTDSFSVEKEAVARAQREGYGVVIISASRDYGLDDLLLGPKELHLVRKSTVPLLLVNPRGDLYTLCD